MSSAMGGPAMSRKAPVLPPDKGSFPLDHFQECKEHMTRYLKCMKENHGDHAACKEDTVRPCRPRPRLIRGPSARGEGLTTHTRPALRRRSTCHAGWRTG